MVWPIPAEGVIADRFARKFEQVFSVDDAGNPLPETVDTSPGTPFGAIAEVADETHTELYLYQQSLAQELMPDTATASDAYGWLPRHGAEWGVPRLQPTTALGSLVFTGQVGAPLPAGIEVSDQGQVWRTVVPAVVPPSGAISIPAEAEQPGSAGNRAAGAVLTLVSAVNGLTSTTATVDAGGLQDGTDIEDVEAWRGRILQRIRTPGAAGATSDYRQWALTAGATYVQVVPKIAGTGTVGVYVGLAGPSVPAPDVLARIDASIQTQRPVTAAVVTLPISLLPVNVTLAVQPDTVGTRAAATLGLQALFWREGLPGTVLPRQRIDSAIAAGDGEYTHLVASPVGDVVPDQGQVPVLGMVTFSPGSALPPRPDGVVG